MAITLNQLQPITHGFAVNGSSADLSNCEELVPAPGIGKAIVLRQVVISCITAITVTIGQEESGNDVVKTLLGPINFNNLGGSAWSWVFVPAIELDQNTSLTIDASASGEVQVFVQGEIVKNITSSSSSSFSSSSYSSCSSSFSSSSFSSSSFSSSSFSSSSSSSFSSSSSSSSFSSSSSSSSFSSSSFSSSSFSSSSSSDAG